MKTSSSKAKARRLQYRVRDDLRTIGKDFGLSAGDVESRGMGQNGVDTIFSPLALKVFPFDIEAKNQESLNVWTIFWEHYGKYKHTKHLKMLVHSKNRCEPTVTMRWCDFVKLYDRYLKIKAK